MNNRFLAPLAQAARRVSAPSAPATYAEVLRDTYSASEIWPLVDIVSGTDILAFINPDRDGTLQGWDLQNAAGPVTGTLAPYLDGANDYGDIDTANYRALFDGSVGGIFGWAKVVNIGSWNDGIRGDVFRQFVDADNFITVRKQGANTFLMQYKGSGKAENITLINRTTVDWFSWSVLWNVSEDSVKFFFNASLELSSVDVGALVGTSGGADVTIGAQSISPAGVWDGWLSYVAVRFGSTWSDADILAMHNAAATAGAD